MFQLPSRGAFALPAALILSLALAGPASAATKPTVKSVAKRVASVEKKTKTLDKNQKSAKKSFDLTKADVAKAGKAITDLNTALAGVKAGAEATAATLAAAAPGILDGLAALKSGLEKLGAAYPAVEYGRAGIFVSGAGNPAIIAGGTLTSGDIPDDGNAITAAEEAVVYSAPGGLVAIDLRAAIRSAESDGDNKDANGATVSETAGQAGGFIKVTDDTGADVICGGSAPQAGGIIGTQAGDQIVTPSGTTNTLPLKNLPGGFPRTDTTAPTNTAASPSLLPGACQFAAGANETYNVRYSVNFLDIPTTATPGPTE